MKTKEEPRAMSTVPTATVKKLYESEERGSIVLADFSGYGEMRKRCVDVELDDRPHDCDGVPIEVGDVLYQTTFEGKPIGDPMEVERYTGNALFVKGLALPINAWSCTHREPDSWERIAGDIESAKGWCDQSGDYDTGLVSISEPKLIKWADRIRKLAAKEGE